MTLKSLNFLMLTAFLLSACSDSGSDSEIADPQQPNGNLPSGSGVNSGLNGRIITTEKIFPNDDDRPVQFDLFTGQFAERPIDTIQDLLTRNGQSDSDRNQSEDSYFGAINTSSIRYIQTVPSCVRHEDNVQVFDSCVAIYSEDLQRQSLIQILNFELNWPAKLSPSGKYLAIHEYISISFDRSSVFALYDVTEPRQIDRHVVDIESPERHFHAGESPIAWTPDDALVYTIPSDDRVVVYITELGSLEVARTIRLPEIYQGEVTSLDVAPDGKKLLMGYELLDIIGEFHRSGVLLLDMETLTISVPAVAESDPTTSPLADNIQGSIRAPIWSPDGQWILMVEGRDILPSPVANLAVSSRLFAVPANLTRTLLTVDTPTEAIHVRLERPGRPGTLSDGWNSGSFRYEASFDWVP